MKREEWCEVQVRQNDVSLSRGERTHRCTHLSQLIVIFLTCLRYSCNLLQPPRLVANIPIRANTRRVTPGRAAPLWTRSFAPSEVRLHLRSNFEHTCVRDGSACTCKAQKTHKQTYIHIHGQRIVVNFEPTHPLRPPLRGREGNRRVHINDM